MERIRDCLDTLFPAAKIGRLGEAEEPDILTGTFGACTVAGLFGMELVYGERDWPDTVGGGLTDRDVARLEPPDLDKNAFFQGLMEQVDWIADHVGPVRGFINWQGVLNTAFRLRGLRVFTDMVEEPQRAEHLFSCIHATMEEGARRLYRRQRETGFGVDFFTVSNCVVNMISPEHYEEFLLPWDRKLAEKFGRIGVHNCAWNANPYLDAYSSLPNVAYIDMGMESDLQRAQALFPETRRALMIPPSFAAEQPEARLLSHVETWANRYGPCDLVFADLDASVQDDRVRFLLQLSACAL